MCRGMLDRVRDRGHSIGLGVAGHAELEEALSAQSSQPGPDAMAALRRLIQQVGPMYEAEVLAPGVQHDVRTVAVPVFDADGRVVLVLSLYGLATESTVAEVESARLDAEALS